MNTYLATFMPPKDGAGQMHAHGHGDTVMVAPPTANPYVVGSGPQPVQAIVTAEDMVQAASRVIAAGVAPEGHALTMLQLLALPVVRGTAISG